MHAAEPVAAEFRAAKPAGHNHDLPHTLFAFEHAQDDHASPGLPIVVLELGAIRQDHGPGVVGGLGELLFAAKLFDEGLGVFCGCDGAAGDRVFGAAVRERVFDDLDVAPPWPIAASV